MEGARTRVQAGQSTRPRVHVGTSVDSPGRTLLTYSTLRCLQIYTDRANEAMAGFKSTSELYEIKKGEITEVGPFLRSQLLCH